MTYMRGMIGTVPAVGTGVLWQEFLDTWGSLNPVDWPGAGNRNVYDFYDPYVYDAVLAFAYGFQYFIDEGNFFTAL
jgi:hypothetical protein